MLFGFGVVWFWSFLVFFLAGSFFRCVNDTGL